MLTRTTLNLWLDLASLVALLGLILTGGLMYFVLPPGTGHSYVLGGLGRHDFGRLHFYLAVAAVALLAAHALLSASSRPERLRQLPDVWSPERPRRPLAP